MSPVLSAPGWSRSRDQAIARAYPRPFSGPVPCNDCTRRAAVPGSGQTPIPYDKARYRTRHLVESLFCDLKQFWRARNPLLQAREPVPSVSVLGGVGHRDAVRTKR